LPLSFPFSFLVVLFNMFRRLLFRNTHLSLTSYQGRSSRPFSTRTLPLSHLAKKQTQREDELAAWQGTLPSSALLPHLQEKVEQEGGVASAEVEFSSQFFSEAFRWPRVVLGEFAAGDGKGTVRSAPIVSTDSQLRVALSLLDDFSGDLDERKRLTDRLRQLFGTLDHLDADFLAHDWSSSPKSLADYFTPEPGSLYVATHQGDGPDTYNWLRQRLLAVGGADLTAFYELANVWFWTSARNGDAQGQTRALRLLTTLHECLLDAMDLETATPDQAAVRLYVMRLVGWPHSLRLPLEDPNQLTYAPRHHLAERFTARMLNFASSSLDAALKEHTSVLDADDDAKSLLASPEAADGRSIFSMYGPPSLARLAKVAAGHARVATMAVELDYELGVASTETVSAMRTAARVGRDADRVLLGTEADYSRVTADALSAASSSSSSSPVSLHTVRARLMRPARAKAHIACLLAADAKEESMVSVLSAVAPFHVHADSLEDGFFFGLGMEHNDSMAPLRDELTELLAMSKGNQALRAVVVQRLLECVEPSSRWATTRVYSRLSLREAKDAHAKLPGVERATIEQLTRQFESSVLIRFVVRGVEVLFRREGTSLMDDHGRLRDMVTKAWLAERAAAMDESPGQHFFNFKHSGVLPRVVRRVQTSITDELLERDSSESDDAPSTSNRVSSSSSSSSSSSNKKKESGGGSDGPPPGPNFDLNNMKDRDKLQLVLLLLMGLYFAFRSQPDRTEAGAQRVEDAGGATSPSELPLAAAQFSRITQRQFQRDLAPLVLGLDPTSSRSAAAAAAEAEGEESLLTHGVPNNRLVVSVDAKSRVAYVYDPHVAVSARPPGARGPPYAWCFTFGSIEAVEALFDEIAADLGSPRPLPVSYMSSDRMDMTRMALSWLPVLILIGGSFYMSRALSKLGGGAGGRGGMGGLFGVGKASNALVKETAVKTKFADVAGLQEAKDEILEFVDFLKNPEKFERLGARVPRGALLAGPPGTGKTLLARAVAGEAKVPFFSMSGSDFTEMFVGVGPARVRDLFKQARESAPCIVFLDEIDAVGRARRKSGFASSDERENTLNQMLVELDGFASKDAAPIVVLAGTNRPDVLDPALMRPGRFDRQISVDLPDAQGRRDILLVHLKPLKLARGVDVTDNDVADQAELRVELAEKLSHMTSGFSGADLANLCNEAALRTARRNGTGVCAADFDGALDRVVAGLERRSRVLSAEERRTVAFHEAGHALAGYFLKGCDPLLRLTIVPRGAAALGYAMYSPLDRRLVTRDQLMDRLCMTLGGRCAEEVAFDNVITTGASDDLDKATKMAYEWVTSLGFTDALGLASYPRPASDDEAMFYERPYSQATSRLIDSEVKKLVELAYTTTKDLLLEHRHHMDVLANALLDRETLTGEDMPALLGPRPGDAEDEAAHAAQLQAKKDAQATESAAESTSTANPAPTPVS